MKFWNKSLITIAIVTAQSMVAAPPFDPMQLCPKIAKSLKKWSSKLPLHILDKLTQCTRIKSRYIRFKPEGGPFDVETILKDGSIYKRMKPCSNCAFSDWQHVGAYPLSDKELKKDGFYLCPDGSISFDPSPAQDQ